MESLKTVWNYRYGKKEVMAATHYEDGVLEWEAKFKDGKLEGMPKEYSETGSIK
jgi:antitoxin component YwqK of YwqJK toxin-antitoxin module